jgi:predicted RNase H-like HicB family nuclease
VRAAPCGMEGCGVFSASMTTEEADMKSYMAIIERDTDTGLYVGYVPGFPGAHSQGESLDELHQNLREVVEMLSEDENPALDAEFIGTQQIVVR